MDGILRQPLLHFLVLGAAIFALNAFFDDAPAAPDLPTIVVSQQDATWLVGQFELTWRRPPTDEELRGLVDDFVREEIYVRQALSLGLDQGDAIVRRRLRQKMEFLTEAGAEAANASNEVLSVHLQENASSFAGAPRVAFRQIMLEDASAASVAEIQAALNQGADPQSFAVPSLLPASVPLSPPQAVDGIFGVSFFDRIAMLEPGVWSGPVLSGFGAHLVQLDTFQEPRLPPLEEIRDRVELDWRAKMARDLRAQRFEELKAQYTIELPDLSAVLAR